MMQKKEYSAGAVKLSFWFAEFRKVVTMLRSGKTVQEIKTLAVNENLFSAATAMRGGQIFNTVSARVTSLPEDYYKLFEESSLETQKLITLLSIMETDALFFDFMNDVYKEKLIIGDMQIADADIRIFFALKQRQSEKVSGWTDGTFVRLLRCYKTYLSEAGLLERGVGDRKIIKPLVDDRLVRLLSDTNRKQAYKIFTGTR
jgi:hypothetical protein